MVTNVELKATKASLIIGNDYAKTNKIEFSIKPSADGKVWLKLQIPVGADGVLRQSTDADDITISVEDANKNALPYSPIKDSPSDKKEWWLGDSDKGVAVGGGTELSLSIGNVLCTANEGSSKIWIIWDTDSLTDQRCPLTIEKTKPTPEQHQGKNPILYFIAEPPFLIGRGKVTLTWAMADKSKALLDTPNELGKQAVSPWEDDRLDKTWTYKLRVEKTKVREATVNVLRKGWNEILPPPDKEILKPRPNDKKKINPGDDEAKTFPSVIFQPGNKKDALHAVFMYTVMYSEDNKPKTTGKQAVLCKSVDGITGWKVEKPDVPEGMESSPGVRLGDRLWLIGGSAVDPDPDQRSAEIWCYDLGQPGKGWQYATVEYSGSQKFEDEFKRMGHACVIYDEKTIWVIGGVGRSGKCLNDVWSFVPVGEESKLKATKLSRADWKPRCMFSAVNFNGTIWVCGGVDSPNGNPLGDIWFFDSDQKWKKRPCPELIENAIGTGAAACGDKLFAVTMKRTGRLPAAVSDRTAWNLERAMSVLPKSEIDELSDSWTKLSAPEWSYSPRSLAVAAFSERLYLRCLHRDVMYQDHPEAPLFVYVI
jgi:Kelch motif/Galactose oxidase, central domain